MKVTLTTTKFQNMVTKASKGLGNDKLFPVTSMIHLYIADGKLTIATTDSENYLYVIDDGYDGEFDVVIPVDKFVKLIQMTTSDNITLEATEDALIVVGNGKYSIPLIVDEDLTSNFPNPVKDIKLESDNKVDMSTVDMMLNHMKQSLAVNTIRPSIANYYVDSNYTLSTNGNVVSSIGYSIFETDGILLSPEYVNLLGLIDSEEAKYICDDEYVIVYTDSYIVYGKPSYGVEDYPADKLIDNFLSKEFDNTCKVNRNQLVATLNRIGLFTGEFDDFTVKMTFNKKSLKIETNDSNDGETVDDYSTDGAKKFDCRIDSKMLLAQVNAYDDEYITIQYGDEKCIKLSNDVLTHIVCLTI